MTKTDKYRDSNIEDMHMKILGNIKMLYRPIYMTLATIFILLAMTAPSYAWRSSSTNIDTHDMIFQKAVSMLPTQEKNKLVVDQTVVYLGLYAPDCGKADYDYCVGDTDRSHYVYYNSNGVVTNDDAALNAQDEYQRAIESFKINDMYNFSLHLGAMSHYVEDPGSWPHVTTIEPFNMHTGYESAVNHENAGLFSGTKSDVRKEMSAYDASLKNAYESTFDTIDSGTYDVNWMYANCGNCSNSNFVLSSNPELFNRTKKILNYDANRLSDVLYKLIREINPDLPTPTPTHTPVPIPTPYIVNYGPKSTSVEGQTPSTMTFNITASQIVDTVWSIDNKIVNNNYSVMKDLYTGTVYTIGNHDVSVTIQNENGTNNKKWNWNIIGIFAIEKDTSSVYVGIPKNVTFTITRECGTESGDICDTETYVPVPGVSISLGGKATGSNTTNTDGKAIIAINTTVNGTIKVTASKSGYLDANTTVSAEIAPTPVPIFHPSSGGSGSSSGGSSGGGGGSAGTAEPYENIYKYEIQEHSVFTTPVSFKYFTQELAIYEVMVTSTQSNIASLRIEVLRNTSKLVDVPAPGIVYKNLNAWVDYKRIKNATIRFNVENSWIDSNKLLDINIRMCKWDSDKKMWTELPTVTINQDDKYTYFESQTDSFSSFAISGIKDESVVTNPESYVSVTTVEDVETAENKPVSTATPKAPGFGMTLSIISILSIACLFRRIER